MSKKLPDSGNVVSATAAEWNATTLPIVNNLFVYETDTKRFKVGDGISLYSQLPYSINGPATTIAAGITRLATEAEALAGLDDTIALTPLGLAQALAAETSSLDVSGTSIDGITALSFPNADHIVVEGNAFLGATVAPAIQLGLATEQISQVVTVQPGSAFVCFEYNAYTATPPVAVSHLESINDCNLFYGTFASEEVFTLATTGDGDTIADIVTGPQILYSHFSGNLTAGEVASTIAVTSTGGRLYLAISDRYSNSVITSEADSAVIDTSYVSAISTSTETDPTGVILGMDLPAGTNNITITPSAPGFSGAASYIGIVLGSVVDQNARTVTLTVPPLLISDLNGNTISSPRQLVLADGTLSGTSTEAVFTSDGGSASLPVTINGTLASSDISGIAITTGATATSASVVTGTLELLLGTGGSGDSTGSTFTVSGVPATFRYVGLWMDIPYGSSGSYVGFQGVAIHATEGGPNICTGGTAHLVPAAANWSGGSPTTAFANGGFAASGIYRIILYYDLGVDNQQSVAEYVIEGWGTSSQCPQVHGFVGSNDGTTFYYADPCISSSWTSAGQTQAFGVSWGGGETVAETSGAWQYVPFDPTPLSVSPATAISGSITAFKSSTGYTFSAPLLIRLRAFLKQETTATPHGVLLSKDGINFYSFMIQSDGNCVAYTPVSGTFADSNNHSGYPDFGAAAYAGYRRQEISIAVNAASNNTLTQRTDDVWQTGSLNETTTDFTTGTWYVYALVQSYSDIAGIAICTSLLDGGVNENNSTQNFYNDVSSDRSVGESFTNTSNTDIDLAVTINYNAGGENDGLVITDLGQPAIVVSNAIFNGIGFTTVTLYATVGRGGSYQLTDFGGTVTIIKWLERPRTAITTTAPGGVVNVNLKTPLAFAGISIDHGPSALNDRFLSTGPYVNNTNSVIEVTVILENTNAGRTGGGYSLWRGTTPISGSSVAESFNNTALFTIAPFLVNPGEGYQVGVYIGSANVLNWYERPISNGLTQGGAVELVSVQNVSDVAEVDFDISQSGYEYSISAFGISSSIATSLGLQFGTGVGPTWDATSGNYNWGANGINAGTQELTGNSSDSLLGLSSGSFLLVSQSLNIDISGDPGKAIFHGVSGTSLYGTCTFGGAHIVTTTMTGARIITTNGGTISGSFYLYRRSLFNIAVGNKGPKLSNFTIVDQPAGSTFTNTQDGIAMYGSSGSIVMQTLLSNQAIGSTVTAIAGFDAAFGGANGGVGIYLVDAANNRITFGISNASAQTANVDVWVGPNDNTVNELNAPLNGVQSRYSKIVFDGTTVTFYTGPTKNTVLPRWSGTISSYIGTPVGVGIYQYLYEGPVASEFFDYEQTA